MALNKIYPASPDSIIKSGKYSEAALARIAHVNDAISQIKTQLSEITPLDGSSGTQAARITNLEIAVNAILAALS